MKKVFSLILLLSLLLCGCSETEESCWQSGQKALAEENYRAAAEAFEKAGDYQDSGRLLLYAKAWVALEEGNYKEAGAGFQSLGDYKDCPLMLPYCKAREKDAVAQTAISSEEMDQAVDAGSEAIAMYAGLPFFRDSSTRAENLRNTLFTYASEKMGIGEYSVAANAFGALGNWQDSPSLQKYCQAAALEAQNSCVEAAALYEEISDFQDAAARAEAAREQAYQTASDLKENGDYLAASEAFAALGSYRDAAEQRDGALALRVRTMLQSGTYAEALKVFSELADSGLFLTVESAEAGSPEMFLTGFMQSWMNAHAGVMSGFFSCNLLQPYLVPGGELDTLLHAELDDSIPQNYGFVFYSADVKELYTLDTGFTAAKVHGSAARFGPEGQTEMEETLWILLDDSGGTRVAAAAMPVEG